jgi:hypothetical protein
MINTEHANAWQRQLDSMSFSDIETRVLAVVPPSALDIRRFWPPLGDESSMSSSLRICLAFGGREPSSDSDPPNWRI